MEVKGAVSRASQRFTSNMSRTSFLMVSFRNIVKDVVHISTKIKKYTKKDNINLTVSFQRTL